MRLTITVYFERRSNLPDFFVEDMSVPLVIINTGVEKIHLALLMNNRSDWRLWSE